jgi:hypothetical protein
MAAEAAKLVALWYYNVISGYQGTGFAAIA